jgi:hypothetical protein
VSYATLLLDLLDLLIRLSVYLGDKIISAHGEEKYEVSEVGIMHPEQLPTGYL